VLKLASAQYTSDVPCHGIMTPAVSSVPLWSHGTTFVHDCNIMVHCVIVHTHMHVHQASVSWHCASDNHTVHLAFSSAVYLHMADTLTGYMTCKWFCKIFKVSYTLHSAFKAYSPYCLYIILCNLPFSCNVTTLFFLSVVSYFSGRQYFSKYPFNVLFLKCDSDTPHKKYDLGLLPLLIRVGV
jgi:hypothetical protein